MSNHAGHNVAVLLTPPGSGAIAVIRLSGPAAESFAAAHLSRPAKRARCVHADLSDGEQVVDDVVVVRNEAGDLDLNVHGGPFVTQAVLRLAKRSGFTVGLWQQHAEHVFETCDDIERQMLIDLPRARSESILRLLTAQPAAWQAMLSANDFSAMQVAFADTALERALAVPTVAIVGPPNVGKSTLANALFGQQRSITADRPGTTRDWVGELADLNGLVIRLIDTPGVRQTSDPIEAQAVQQASQVISSADCIVVTVDGSRPLDDSEREVLHHWSECQPIVVRTKSDRPRMCDISPVDVSLSAFTGEGLNILIQHIHQRLKIFDLVSPIARCWTVEHRYKLGAILNVAPR